MQINRKSPIGSTKALIAQKNSDTAILLGSGQSINRITDAQWDKIIPQDIWAVNNWVYHPFIIPYFYHIEAKWYNYKILQKRLKEKQFLYQDVCFIFPKSKLIQLHDGDRPLLRDIVPFDCARYEYDLIGRDKKRTHTPFTSDYEMDNRKLTKSYDMSITLIFEMLYKFGYDRIITFGIDLHNSYYFWTGKSACGEVHHQTNKAHENKNPEEPHATHRVKDFIIDFNKRWMKPFNRSIGVGHQDTDLYPHLPYVPVEDL